MGLFGRKSEKSPHIDPKIMVLGSENRKMGPYRTDSEDSRRQKSGGRKSGDEISGPQNVRLWSGITVCLDILGTTKYPGLYDPVLTTSRTIQFTSKW